MKIILGLLLSTVLCAAEPANQAETKPSNIRDGQAAESYISKALYDFLEKPPYSAIVAETPFTLKRIAGKNVWMALVDFYCGLNEEAKLHGETDYRIAVEHGDPILDLSPAVMAALDPAKDEVGLTLDMARMPQRVRQAADVNLDEL